MLNNVLNFISIVVCFIAMVAVSAVDDPVYGMWMLSVFVACCICLTGVVYIRDIK